VYHSPASASPTCLRRNFDAAPGVHRRRCNKWIGQPADDLIGVLMPTLATLLAFLPAVIAMQAVPGPDTTLVVSRGVTRKSSR
jgi:hypothetical protein